MITTIEGKNGRKQAEGGLNKKNPLKQVKKNV